MKADKVKADKGGKPAKNFAKGVLLYTRYALDFLQINRLERLYISFILYDDFFNNKHPILLST